AKGYASTLSTIGMRRSGETRCDIDLEPGGTVDVLVVDETGAPTVNARVDLLSEPDGPPSSYPEIWNAAGLRTGVDGHVLIEGVSLSNPLPIQASAVNRPTTQLAQPHFAPGQTRTEMKFALGPWHSLDAAPGGAKEPFDFSGRLTGVAGPTPRARIVQGNLIEASGAEGKGPKTTLVFEGRVADLDGKPVGGARILWGEPSDLSQAVEVAATQSDGHYRANLETKDNAVRWLMAHKEGYALAGTVPERPGAPEASVKLDFILREGHWLAGVVVDSKQRPIEDASIRAEWVAEQGGSSPVPPVGMPRTKADGRFRFDYVAGPRLELSVGAEGKESVEKTVAVDEDVVIVLTEALPMRGRVIDRDSERPIPDFTLQWFESQVRFNDPDGLFELRRFGGFTIEARGYAPRAFQPEKPSSPGQIQEFRLIRSTPLAGAVVDADSGAPVAGAAIALILRSFDYPSFDISAVERLMRSPDLNDRSLALSVGPLAVRNASTDAQGRFALDDGAPPGALIVGAQGYQRAIVLPEERALFQQGGRLCIPLEPGGAVFGACYDRNEFPKPGMRVELVFNPKPEAPTPLPGSGTSAGRTRSMAGATYLTMIQRAAQTDSSGLFRFDGLPAGRGRVASDRWTRSFQLAPGEQTRVDLIEDPGTCTLHGRVLQAGQPQRGVAIALSPLFLWECRGLQATTDAQGDYTIAGLKPGEYTAGATTGSPPRHIAERVLVQGDTRHDFVFGALRQVTGRFVFGRGVSPALREAFDKAVLSLSEPPRQPGKGEGADRWAESKIIDGCFAFSGRFQGEYRLSAHYRLKTANASISIPQPLVLDNLAADQDLDDIEMPALGAIRITTQYDPPNAARPRNLYAGLQKRQEGRRPTDEGMGVGLDGSLDIQTIELIEPGRYDVGLHAQAWRVEPETQMVTVEPDAVAAISMTLRPIGELGFTVELLSRGIDEETTVTATITGPVGEQRQTAKTWLPPSRLAVGEARFSFSDLEPGDYRYQIDAPGFEPCEGTTVVALGAVDPKLARRIRLNRLP
ncbi:MAG: hypothetical protein NTW86_24440, partial [Candidatus Sumerlaeota bacterium]|nr:hypothetical protein [Candidatus Sumerlaeota bacterium]